MAATWDLGELRDALRRCAGCHDQCLGVTGEVVATGDQSLALSRLAAMVLRLADGVSPWSPAAAARLFVGAADDIADEVCIHRESGHRVTPWLRQARARSLHVGMAPELIRSARDAAAATGNIWGLEESLSPPLADGPTSIVLLHEATGRLVEGDIPAQHRLIGRMGRRAGDLALSSSGALELELGMFDEARAAAKAALRRIRELGRTNGDATTYTSADPHLVWMLTAGVTHLGLAPVPGLEHLSVVLRRAVSGPTSGGSARGARTVVYHDTGILGRRLDVIGPPRDLLDAAGLARREARTSLRLARSDGGLPAALGEPVAMEVARLRLEELRATGAETVVVAGPIASLALRSAIRADDAIAVQDLFVLLDALTDEGPPR